MPAKLFTVDATAKATYDAAPNVVPAFEPTEYIIRPDANNTAEAMISFDGKEDAYQVALPQLPGGIPVTLRTRSPKVWVKRVSNAACIVLITAKTDN